MKLNSLKKTINHTEKAMGFISLSKNEIWMFPNVKTKIFIESSLLPNENIICTWDPKYKRIYGLRKLIQGSRNNSVIIIKVLENKFILNIV